MKVNMYRLLEDQIQLGVDAGIRRAFEKVEDPDEDVISRYIMERVMVNISEYIEFDDFYGGE